MSSLATNSSDAAWARTSKLRISAGIAASAWAGVPVQGVVALSDASPNSPSRDSCALANVAALGWNFKVFFAYWSRAMPSTRRLAHAAAPLATIDEPPEPGAKLVGSSAAT